MLKLHVPSDELVHGTWRHPRVHILLDRNRKHSRNGAHFETFGARLNVIG
jgi:hypothetical protein